MSTPGDPPPQTPPKEQTVRIKVGKYAGILTAAFLVTQLLCSFGLEFVP